MAELVNIIIDIKVIVLILIETKASDDLSGNKIHNQNICIFAPNSHQGALGIKIGHLSIYARHNHGCVIWEDYVIRLHVVYLLIHF